MEDKSGFPDEMPPTIGRYKVQEGIGYGAMGAVYKAFDPLIKRTLAIKTIRLDIPKQSPQYKSFIERFYHEARISGTLSHPNIVTLFDIGEERGVPYLAMEFVEGETISFQIEKGTRFKPEKVIALVSQIASAVDYAHTKGVIHRDIKPSNLILYEGDRIKVTDFGIAKLVDSEMTQSGTLLGTPSYMSPEQAMGEKLDGRSDIFSLGVCAFEMLSGEQPFPGANVTSILYKLVHVDPIEPANLEMHGLVPQKWHEVFSKVLAKKPDDRYQTATAFVQDLEYCLGAWFGSAMGDEGGATMVGVTEAEIAEGTTKAIPRIELDRPSPPAPAAPADERPATILMKSAPSPPPASKKQEERPATILMKPTEPPPPPAPKREEEKPATILMKSTEVPSAPSEKAEEDDKASTIISKAAPEATILMKGGSPKEAKPVPKEPDAPATILMSSPPKAPVREEVTIQQPIPEKVLKAAPPPRPPSLPRKPATPAAGEEATPPKKSALPTGLLIGGVALVVLALGVIGIVVLLRRVLPTRGPSPTTLPPASFAVETPAPPPTTAVPAPLASGVIHVESAPAGASVLLNGTQKGIAPMDLGALPFGTYEVRLELKGYEPRSTSIVLSEEKPRGDAKVTLPKVAAAMAVADVVSTPFGATVTVDGRKVGQTPLTDYKIAPGAHKVQIAREGYEPWSGELRAELGKRGRVDVTLKALPAPSPSATAFDPNRIYRNASSDVETLARKTSGPEIDYPSNAPHLRRNESVSLQFEFVVDEKGDVSDVQIKSSGGKILDDSVLSTVRKWKFQPAVKQGKNVKVRVERKQTFLGG